VPASTTAGIITAIASATSAVTVMIVTVAALPVFNRRTKATLQHVNEVRTLVNGHHTEDMQYQSDLIERLDRHGIAVPPNQAIPPPSP
jgi:hypothetical protein